MPIKKNHTNNPNGRPKGKPNKITQNIRQVLKSVFESELENIPELLAECEPSARLEIIIKIMPFLIPKSSSIESEPQTATSDPTALISATLQRLQSGLINADQAKAELQAVDCLLKVKEQTEIMDKLTEIENKLSEVKQ